MQSPETYSDLRRWFNCQQLKKYYNISDENLEKIYFLLKKGRNIKGSKDVITIYDPKGKYDSISIRVSLANYEIDGVTVVSNVFRVIYPASYYSSLDSGGSSSNNNNNNNNNNNH